MACGETFVLSLRSKGGRAGLRHVAKAWGYALAVRNDSLADALLDRFHISSFHLTVEQVLGLGKGLSGRRQIRSMANRDKWLRCGRTGACIWGEYAVTNRPPWHVSLDVRTLAVVCSCTVRQRPCNHAAALYLHWLEHAADLPAAAPAWLTTLPSDTQRLPEATPTRAQAVQQGLVELEQWLHDLVRTGLAELPARPQERWRSITNRLADAHLDELARTVKEMAARPMMGHEWPSSLLADFGRLHLQVEAFKRWKELPSAEQGDLRLAVGWLDRALLAAGARLNDKWQIVAEEQQQLGSIFLRRTWLWAERAHRPANLVTSHASGSVEQGSVREQLLPAGAGVRGALTFFPATSPTRAELDQIAGFYQPDSVPSGLSTVTAVEREIRRAWGANPWLRELPFLLTEMDTRQSSGGWRLYDRAGRALPLVADFDRGWHLRALNEDADAALFGLWTRGAFRPLSVWSEGRWLKLDTLRSIK